MRALLFDVFGTCVDWRTSMMREVERFGLPPQARRGVARRVPAAAGDRAQRQAAVGEPRRAAPDRAGQGPPRHGPDAARAGPRELVKGWHRLDPWPDVVEGLTKLKETHIIAPCSNGHIAQSVNLAKYAKLPWDAILGAEIARAYKPDPRVYLESVYALGLEPHEVCMVAAHRAGSRAAAADVGLSTAFVERFGEDPGPPFDADIVAYDFVELASR